MTRALSDDRAHERLAEQEEVAQQIQDLVANQLVREVERTVDDAFLADDQGVLQRAAFGEAHSATRAGAILAYQRALELARGLADAHCNLGSIHYHQNRKGLARRCFERALELDALHLEANLNMATLLEEVGRDEAALSHYRRALESDPFCADALVSIGLLFEKFGLRRRASEAWRRYLQLEPEGPWAQVARPHLEG